MLLSIYTSHRLLMYKGPCQIEVGTSSESLVTSASFLDIWRAGVAVNTMCVQFGKAGTASGIGESFRWARGRKLESPTFRPLLTFLRYRG